MWTYSSSNNYTVAARNNSVVSPDGSVVVHHFDSSGLETETDWKASSSTSTIDRKVEMVWGNDGVDDNGQPFNPHLDSVTTTLGTVQKATTLYYNSTPDVQEQHESDWYAVGGTLVPLTCTQYTYQDSGYIRRVKSVEVDAWSGAGGWNGTTCGTMVSKTVSEFDEGTLTTRSVSSGTGKSTPFGDRLNVTTIKHYGNSSTHLDETFTYDDLGNVLTHTTPGSHTTTIGYTDSFNSSGRPTTFAYPTTVTDALGDSTVVYNYPTGLPVSSTDVRSLTTTQAYDLMNRVATVTEPNGLVTHYAYDDSNLKATVSADIASGISHTVETSYDMLSRPTRTIERDPAGDVVVDTQYDGNGRAYRVSAPYRSGASPVWTETAYDSLSRPTTIANPDSTTVTLAYSNNVTTVTDEAGNPKRTTVNALGQTTKVEELNSSNAVQSTTDYAYDLAGGLHTVTQSSQTRTFTRDIFGRLTSEAHPETGTTSYTYYDDGSLHTRTDALSTPTVTTYAYDSVGRLLTTVYSDGTPTVTNTYDQTGHGVSKGAITTMADGAGSVSYHYDAAGNLDSETRTFTGVSGTFTTSYAYDLEGKLTSVTYPSGRVVAQTYATGSGYATSRLNSLTSTPPSGSATTLIGSVSDNAAGEITSQTLGNGVVQSRSFNSRFQLTGINASLSGSSLLDLSYGYGSSNNGAIRSRTDSLQPEHSVAYSYDSVQRLSQVSASAPAWTINWGYDVYGNRTSQSRSGIVPSVSQSISYSNNRNTSLTYDNNGNVTFDNQLHYDYDGENRLRSVESGSITYVYDGDGRRVKRTDSSGTTYSIYGLTGLMSEFTTVGNGATAAASTDRLQYRVGEQTGTGVLVMNASGAVIENNRVLPFGESWQSAALSTNNEKFTTYQRDATTGLDYAMARDYSKIFGSFYSPDPGHVGASIGDPRSWNAYVYSRNDPVNLIDPTGLKYTVCLTTNPCAVMSNAEYINEYIRRRGSSQEIELPSPGDVGAYTDIMCPESREGTRFCGTVSFVLDPIVISVPQANALPPPPANKEPQVGAPSQQSKPATSGLEKYLSEYVPCATSGLIDHFIGDEDKAGLTTALHVAPFASASLQKGSPYLYVAIAGFYDISSAFQVRQTCSKSVYGRK